MSTKKTMNTDSSRQREYVKESDLKVDEERVKLMLSLSLKKKKKSLSKMCFYTASEI